MITRRGFLSLAGVLLPLPVGAQVAMGRVHQLSGEVLLNGYPLSRTSAIQPGQTVRTGGDGNVWFSVGGDAYFLRPGSELRLRSTDAGERLIDALRLVTGALGATFQRSNMRRTIVAQTATIGIRGTGVYVEATPLETYACTCFGSTEMISTASGTMMESVAVAAENHQARRIHRDPMMGMRVVRASFERHTSQEMIRLESLVGRTNPFPR
jgi:hypothetical protein